MRRIQYIATHRARFQAIDGSVNLPWGTELELVDGFLVLEGAAVCAVTSQSAHEYFARNDDGEGLVRGCLTAAIIRRLSKRNKDYQVRWDRIWGDPLSQKYRKKDHIDFWLWSHEFYGAPLHDLRHIADIAGVPQEAT